MHRKQNFILNTISSLFNQIVVILCGFILPRLILSLYGSNVNGLIQSITQFISLAGIFDAGMGVVIEACLFKPLAEFDTDEISRVLTSGQKFYYKFVAILFIYIVILTFLMPQFAPGFNPIFTITLLLSISVSSFGQYCLGVTNSILLSADQKKYVNLNASSLVIIFNTLIGAFLMKNNCSIQLVKLVASIVYIMRPIFLSIYVKKNYNINWHAQYDKEPIRQKWNGFAQHLAFLVVGNTDVTVLTIMSSLENVSVYSTYFLVINGIKTLITACTSGFDSLLGNMLAKQENNNLNKVFSSFEVLVHLLVISLFGTTIKLIVPFVMIYTRGITDADYFKPCFAAMICVAYTIFCLRIPYLTIVKIAGQFKETQLSSINEAIINIVISVITVAKFGLIGVAFGTLIAMTYRTIYLVFYIKKHIIFRSMKFFVKNIFVDILLSLIMFVTTFHLKISDYTYFSWINLAVKVSFICFVEAVTICFIFYKRELIFIMDKLKKI